VKLPAWAGGHRPVRVYVATAIPRVRDRGGPRGDDRLFADPVGRMLIGPGYGFDDPDLRAGGRRRLRALLPAAAALMSILLVTRHTRVEEQSGGPSSSAPAWSDATQLLTATLVVALITNVAAGRRGLLALVGVGGFAITGSALLGAAVAGVGLAFAGHHHDHGPAHRVLAGRAGMAGAALGAAFVLRAGGDMAAEGGTLLSWLSPLGWGQQTAPYVLDRWWPLALLGSDGGRRGGRLLAVGPARPGASLFAVRRSTPRPPIARHASGAGAAPAAGQHHRLGRGAVDRRD
jgi:ABC-2 type transport system permease protein